MSPDEHRVTLPKLYGSPAYARPPKVVAGPEHPFDPDALPLEVHQTPEEREFASAFPARTYAPDGAHVDRNGHRDAADGPGLRPRTFSLRAIAGRLLGGD